MPSSEPPRRERKEEYEEEGDTFYTFFFSSSNPVINLDSSNSGVLHYFQDYSEYLKCCLIGLKRHATILSIFVIFICIW